MAEFARTELEIQKDALHNVREINSTVVLGGEPNAAVLEIEHFGFSANNITYALLGDRFGYWGFFPASEGYGITPVWGFAKVVASNTNELNVGERVYGYLPMATHLVIHADKITPQGFSDANPSRKSISPVYDHYVRCDADPTYSDDMRAWLLTFRPLYTTSFVLAYVLAERAGDEKTRVWFTSASSKTAYGTAQILREIMPNAELCGVTSAKQKAFVEQIDCYHSVYTYDEMSDQTCSDEDWVLDFAGDQARLIEWRSSHQNATPRTLLIGATDVQAQTVRAEGSVGHVFFAPDEVRRFHKEWGVQTFQQRYIQHFNSFVKHFGAHLTTASHSGSQSIVKQFQHFVDGSVDPSVMHEMTF